MCFSAEDEDEGGNEHHGQDIDRYEGGCDDGTVVESAEGVGERREIATEGAVDQRAGSDDEGEDGYQTTTEAGWEPPAHGAEQHRLR